MVSSMAVTGSVSCWEWTKLLSILAMLEKRRNQRRIAPCLLCKHLFLVCLCDFCLFVCFVFVCLFQGFL